MRSSTRLQVIKVNNLLKYLTTISKSNDSNKNDLSILFEELSKTIVINEEEIKKLLNQVKDGVSPIDIMILSIYYIEKIINKGNISLSTTNKYSIFWIVCILSCKYVLSYDYEIELEYLANLGGFSISDYAKLESLILRDLDWSLWIPDPDYNRLTHIAKHINIEV